MGYAEDNGALRKALLVGFLSKRLHYIKLVRFLWSSLSLLCDERIVYKYIFIPAHLEHNNLVLNMVMRGIVQTKFINLYANA